MADYRWSRDGGRSDDLHEALDYVVGAFALTIVAVIQESIALQGLVGAWFWMSGAVLFSACAVWMLVLTARVLIRRWMSGMPRIHFEQFPMFLGQKMRVQIECSRALRCRSLRVTLRCIQEAYVFSAVEDDAKSVFCHAHYTDSRELGAESWRSVPGFVTIEMDLPAYDLSSALAERPPRYWTLTLHGDAPWLDVYAVFLLPVYGPPPDPLASGGSLLP
jgi:hypothetical protein